MDINTEQMAQIFNTLDETVILFSESGEYLNVFGSEVSENKEKPDFIGKNLSDTLSVDTAAYFMVKIQEAIEKQSTLIVEYQVSSLSVMHVPESSHDKNTRYYRAKILPVSNSDSGQQCVAWIAYDITEYRALEMNLKNSALEDPVTGIYNRRFFFKELNNFFQRFVRGSNVYSVIMVNIDHSEKLSDTYGMEVTENMMTSFIGVIKNALRNTDLFANTGSEDFIVLLPDTPSNGAALMADRVRSAIENHIFELEGEQYNVTASFGCSGVSEKDSSYDNVINRAEIALYQAKHGGGNTVNRLDYENWNK